MDKQAQKNSDEVRCAKNLIGNVTNREEGKERPEKQREILKKTLSKQRSKSEYEKPDRGHLSPQR